MARIFLLLVLLLTGCATANAPLKKEDFQPIIHDLGSGMYAFEVARADYKNPQAMRMARDSFREGMAGWIGDHPELDVRAIVPMEMNNGVTYKVLIFTVKR